MIFFHLVDVCKAQDGENCGSGMAGDDSKGHLSLLRWRRCRCCLMMRRTDALTALRWQATVERVEPQVCKMQFLSMSKPCDLTNTQKWNIRRLSDWSDSQKKGGHIKDNETQHKTKLTPLSPNYCFNWNLIRSLANNLHWQSFLTGERDAVSSSSLIIKIFFHIRTGKCSMVCQIKITF